MKKVLLLALPVLAAALFIPAAFAGNNSANKATGDFWYGNLSDSPAHFVFNARRRLDGNHRLLHLRQRDDWWRRGSRHRPHAVPRHGGQHPGPLQRLIRPPTWPGAPLAGRVASDPAPHQSSAPATAGCHS